MRSCYCLPLAVLVGVLWGLCLAEPQWAWAHGRRASNPEIVFQTGDDIAGLTILNIHPTVALSRGREVVILAQFSDGTSAFVSNRRGILFQPGEVLDGETVRALLTPPVLEADGGFVFNCLVDGLAVCSESDVLVDQGDVIDGRLIFQAFAPATNRRGDIAFVANYLDENGVGGQGVFTLERGLVVGRGDIVDGVPFFAPTSGVYITRRGRLAFLGAPTSQLEQSGVYTETRFLLAVGETVEGHVIDVVSSPTLTDRGEVIALLRLTDGDQWIYSTTRGIVLRDTQLVEGTPIALILDYHLDQGDDILASVLLADGRGAIISEQRRVLLDTRPIAGRAVLQFGDFAVQNQHLAVQMTFRDGADAVLLTQLGRQQTFAARW